MAIMLWMVTAAVYTQGISTLVMEQAPSSSEVRPRGPTERPEGKYAAAPVERNVVVVPRPRTVVVRPHR